MFKEIKNKTRKWLCKMASQYQDGKLVVSGHMVIGMSAMGIVLTTLVGRLVSKAIYALYTDPITAIHNASTFGILLVIASIIVWLLLNIVPWYVLDKIAKHVELTCDRIIFPEEVKAIFAQIEALDKDNQALFMKGLNPLLRKLGEDV